MYAAGRYIGRNAYSGSFGFEAVTQLVGFTRVVAWFL